MRPEQRTKITRQLVRPKHRAYNFSSFFSGVGSILQNWNIQSKFFKFILPVPESNLYPLTLASVIACAGSVEEFILTQEWSLICTIYSWYPSLTCIHYASFGISVCRFRERIYSLTRVSLKFHDPCEVLARIWKAQNSPRLLPWIYSVLRLKYAEPSKFTVFKIWFWRSKETPTEKFHFVKEQRNSNTEISCCKGAKKLPIHKNWI